MLFNSIDFAIFLPIVFFLYWFVVNKNLKLKNASGATVVALAMQCFDDGIEFGQGRLEVQVVA